MSARLPAHLWVSAYIRRCNGAGKAAVLVRRGEAMGGIVLIRVDYLDGRGQILSPFHNMEGEKIWLRALGAEPKPWADTQAYIERQEKRDPDFWLIDVEAGDGDPLLDEPIEG